MKKKLIAVMIIGVLLLAACTKVEAIDDIKQNKTSMFVEVERADTWTVVYNKKTRVMYAVSFSGDNFGNFTLLVNADGSPMLWEE
jgi:hypothetical protein